jgi:hypothetical protein
LLFRLAVDTDLSYLRKRIADESGVFDLLEGKEAGGI